MKNRETLKGIMKATIQPACYILIAVVSLVWMSAAGADSGDGKLLRRETDQICYGCHKIEMDSTKVNAGALRIHNSLNTASEKWDSEGVVGWGIAGGKYGEFKCTTCHTTHNTQNIFMIKETITAPSDNLPGNTVDFRTRLGTPGVTIGTMADDTNHDATSTNVCRVCHSKNKVHNYNWALNVEEHHNADNCSNCHSHDKGFSVQCGECHGDKNAQPVTGLPISLETLVNKLGGTGSVTPGKHEKHYTVQKYPCTTCHGVTAHDTRIEIAFTFKGKNTGTYTGRAMSNGFTYNAGTGTTVTGAGGMKCTNIYCHSNAEPLSKANAYREVVWDGAATTCASCHDQKGSSTAPTELSGAHSRHVDDGWYKFTCNQCHNDTASDNSTVKDRTKHVNATKDIAFTAGGSYNGTAHSCSSVYCHSNAKLGTLVGAYTTPVWDAVGTNCSSCHGNSPAYAGGAAGSETANSHPRHASKNIGCQKCHALTTTTGTTITGYSTHVNNQVDVWFNPLSTTDPGGTYTPGDIPGIGKKSCSISRCHGSGTPQWGGVVVCGTCHVIDNTLAGRHSSHFGRALNHGVALSTADGLIATGNASTEEQYAFKCGDCHYNTVHGGGSQNDNRAAEVLFDTDNAGGGTYTEGSSQGQDPKTSYNWTAGTCASTYCHSQGTTTTAPYLAPVNNAFNWASSANIDADYNIKCKGCHKYTAASGTAMVTGNHVRHVTAYSMGCSKCHYATTTTGTTITDKSKHINRQKEVSWDTTNTGGTAYNSTTHACDNIYCHSTGRSNASPYPAPNTAAAWTGGGMPADCSGCHGGDKAAAVQMTSGSHQAHINNAVVIGTDFSCDKCHSATVQANSNSLIGTLSNHTNKVVNISFTSVTPNNSGASYNGTAAPTGKTPGTADGICGTLYCHSSGKGSYRNPVWSGAAIGCNGCHGTGNVKGAPDYPTAGTGEVNANSHDKHAVNVTYNYNCSKCHKETTTNGTSITGTRHIDNNVQDVYFDALPGASYTAGAKTCNSVYCHSSGKGTYANPVWGNTLGCNGCHGTGNAKGAPDYASGAAGTETANSHAKHTLTQVYTCAQCHNQTTTTGTSITGARHVDTSVNDVYFDAAGAYDTGTRTCSNLYCHSNVQGVDKPVQWGATLAADCSSCHDKAGTTGVPTTLSNRHSMHTDAGALVDTGMGTERYGFTCSRCHNDTINTDGTIKDRQKHADQTKDIVFASEAGGTFNSGTKACTNIYCHSQARRVNEDPAGEWKTPYKAVTWNNDDALVNMTCYSCHKGSTDDDNAANCGAIGGHWDADNGYCKSPNNTSATCAGTWNSANLTCDESPVSNNSQAECEATGQQWFQACRATYTTQTSSCSNTSYSTQESCQTNGGIWTVGCEDAGGLWTWNAEHRVCYFYTSYIPFNGTVAYNTANASYNTQANCGTSNGVWSQFCSSQYNTQANCTAVGGIWDVEKQRCRSTHLSMYSNGHARLIGRDWIRQYPCFYCHDATMTAECKGGTIDSSKCATKGGTWNAAANGGVGACYYLSEAECKDVNAGGAAAIWSEFIKDKDKHINGGKDVVVNFSRWSLFGSTGSELDSPKYNSETKVCSNIYCHTDGTQVEPVIKDYAWSGGHKECNGCHGHEDTGCVTCHPNGPAEFTEAQKWFKAMPVYANGGPGSAKANSHSRHVFTEFSCEACHNNTVVGACKNCHSDNPSGAMGESGHVNAAYHVNKRKDIAFQKGGTYDSTTKECSNTACHSTIPQWGGSVSSNITCFSCHQDEDGNEMDDYEVFNSTQARINIAEWTTTGHGRPAASGNYAQSGNPAADFPAFNTGNNPCSYCHDSDIMHNTPENPFRLRQHKQFESHFEKECVYCHMEGTDPECWSCHDTGESIAPQLSSINRIVSQRPDHRGWAGTSQTCITNQDGITCHPDDATRHDTAAGAWDSVKKADLKSQYVFIGVCLKCHDDDSTAQCNSCHSNYNSVDCANSDDASKKYAVGFNPTQSEQTLCRKPTKAKATSFHFGYKHYGFFQATGGLDANGNRVGTTKGGRFCWDCHDPHGDANIYMIHGKVSYETDGKFGIPAKRAPVTFLDKAATSYAKTSAPFNGICNVCHGRALEPNTAWNAKHYTYASGDGHNANSGACTKCHEHRFGNSHASGQSCTNCHLAKPVARQTAFGQPRDCVKCHNGEIGPGICSPDQYISYTTSSSCTTAGGTWSANHRMNIMGQFNAASHHVQGVTVTGKHCYKCHWEASEHGMIDIDYHEGWNFKTNVGTPGAKVDLVVWQPGATPTVGTRPSTYTLYANGIGTAIQFTANNRDSSGPVRSEVEKVTPHCISCHSDQMNDATPFEDCKTPRQYAWDRSSVAARYSNMTTTAWGKYSSTTYTNANKKDTVTKAYSAHGNATSNAGGKGDTTNGLDAGTITNTRAGAFNVQCFDCHGSHGSATGQYGPTASYATFNGTRGGGNLKETIANTGGYVMSYKASSNSSGINPYSPGAGQCFDCHETQNASTTSSGKPWGYLSTFGAADAIMGYKDTLRFGTGTKASTTRTGYTYKQNKAMMGGHLKRTLQGQSGQATVALQHTPEAQIGGLCAPCHDPHGVSATLGADMAYGVPLLKGTWMTSPYKDDAAPNNRTIYYAKSSSPYPNAADAPGHRIDQNTFAAWSWSSKTKISETVDQFAGLCIKCHPQNKDGNGIDKDASSTWRSMDRIHDTVKGWGGNGQNAGNAIHAFPCAKCHQPHVSGLPRLMTTNCIDYNHKGKVASGGTPGRLNYNGSKNRGGGTFPSGGAGGRTSLIGFQGGYNNLLYCHDGTNADAFPAIEKWNTLIGW